MSIRRRLVAIAVAGFHALAAPAWAVPDACTRFMPIMENGRLYAVPAGCKARSCLQELDRTESSVLDENTDYTFMYKTFQTPIRNSVVVVQVKTFLGAGAEPNDKISDVELSRDEVEFGCRGFFGRNVRIDSIPSATRPFDPPPTVTYRSYDDYHRRGVARGEDGSFIQDRYHVRYYNGQRCIDTRSARNRVQFLLSDRGNYPRGPGKLVDRFGGVGTAVAEEDQLYALKSIQVRMTNYSKSSQAPGCFSFPIHLEQSDVSIGLADLEDKSTLERSVDRARIDEWRIETTNAD